MRLAKTMTEAELMELIREACAKMGLKAYHTHDSRRSEAGYPDWTIVGPKGVIFRECKGYDRRGRKGVCTLEQGQWILALNGAGHDARVWDPDLWHTGQILKELEALR